MMSSRCHLHRPKQPSVAPGGAVGLTAAGETFLRFRFKFKQEKVHPDFTDHSPILDLPDIISFRQTNKTTMLCIVGREKLIFILTSQGVFFRQRYFVTQTQYSNVGYRGDMSHNNMDCYRKTWEMGRATRI